MMLLKTQGISPMTCFVEILMMFRFCRLNMRFVVKTSFCLLVIAVIDKSFFLSYLT